MRPEIKSENIRTKLGEKLEHLPTSDPSSSQLSLLTTGGQAALSSQLSIPRHIAIIMDGNGRWAQQRHLPRIAGHKAGVKSVQTAVRTCGELGIQALTLYAFSTENWSRPKFEVQELMKLLAWTLQSEVEELHKNGVRLRASGRIEALPSAVQQELSKAICKLQDNKGLTLNLALNYGSRQEILDAVNRLLQEKQSSVDETTFSRYLYTEGLPDPDLVIRTSGEMRLSNFLLWQLAYAEIYVTPTLWPDFGKDELVQALLEFQKRNRRFGGI
ncbi:MAG: isoprenyl transferase [Elusimicrobia bacterium]|nr:isoprenyl transferase [Elusimicrobiota bacterium]